MSGSVAPLAPKGLFGAVFSNVSLCTATVAGPVSVAFPSAVIIAVVRVNVRSILVCVHNVILLFLIWVGRLMSVRIWAIMAVGHCGF